MKRTLCVAMAASILLAVGGGHEAFPQEPPPAGAYTEASTADREVVSAANFAVSRLRRKRGGRVSLVSIERAETQVVAGVNYRLCLRVRRRGRAQEVVAVVYRDLRQRYSLTSWKVERCGRGD